MKSSLNWRVAKSEWPLALFSLAILSLYGFYVLEFVLHVPYSGLTIVGTTRGWQVNDSTQPNIAVQDVLLAIGDLTHQEYYQNRFRVPFAGYEPGDEVTLTLQDRSETIVMPQPTLRRQVRRFVSTLVFVPFWFAGTLVLLLLRPRNTRWFLLALFMYLVALWAALGTIGNTQVAGSRVVLGCVSWLSLPVMLHLHLEVPRPIFHRFMRYGLPVLYATAVLMCLLEVLLLAPRTWPSLAFAVGLLASLSLLIFRRLSPSSTASERIATRLMLVGIGLAFLPGLVIYSLPVLLESSATGELAITIAYVAVPILPFFYIYAVYKRQLGALELRVNRLLSQYSFLLLFPPIFLAFLWLGLQLIDSPGARTIYLLLVSVFFVALTPLLHTHFRRWINRLAYGTEYDPDEIVRAFANRIPSARRRTMLTATLKQDVLPSLLIRQSALYLLLDDAEGELFYEQNAAAAPARLVNWHVRLLRTAESRYLPPPRQLSAAFSWVRLVVPLVARGQTLGFWLFGRRDPDDFYPQYDIELLQTLANQLAPVIENIRLVETLQEQVAERTAELREERDRTRAILDSAGEGVFFMNADGIILYVNPALVTMTGYGAGELLQQKLDLLQSETAENDHAAAMWQAINAGESWQGDLAQRRKNGDHLDVRLTLAPLRLADGEVSGFVGVQSNISKLKEIDRLKSNIIANVSHELKTPLANITLYLQLLERGKVEKHSGYLSVLQRETERLTRLIRSLLDLSQLDAGSLPLHFAPTDLAPLVTDIVAAYRPQARAKQLTLHVAISPRLARAWADAGQVEQVVINLLVNALTYTPAGGTITITAGEGAHRGKPGVWLRIHDTGLGIAPEEIPHLFDRFYRGQASYAVQAPGTGLGLAICKQIIDYHEGALEVESKPGEGTAFTVWLLQAATAVHAPAEEQL